MSNSDLLKDVVQVMQHLYLRMSYKTQPRLIALIFAAFIYFKKAFDSVSRSSITKYLFKADMPHAVIGNYNPRKTL